MGLLSKIFKPIGKVLGVVFKPIGKLLKKWLVPKIDQPEKNGFEVQQFGANNTIPIVYGPQYVAGTIVDMNVTDGPGAVKNEYLHLLVVFCVGPVDVLSIQIDGQQPDSGKYAGKVEVVKRYGLPGQTAILEAIGNFQRFDAATSLFPGLAYAYIKLIQDGDQSTFNGIPEITAWVSGRKVSNIPGRPAGTFYWTNPAVCLYDYMTDPIWGAGLNSNDIDVQSFIDVADACDTMVPVSYRSYTCTIDSNNVYSCSEDPDVITTTKQRHTIAAVIDTGRNLFDNMQQISNVFRGFWPDSSGLVRIGIEQEGDPVFWFDESNILRGTMTMFEPDVSERYNRVTVRYQDSREVTKPFAREVSYPQPGDALYTDWLAADNGVPHELTLDADGIGNPWEALQLAIVAARTSRANTQIKFDAQPAATECDVGDIIAVSWDDYGWTEKTFRISDISYNPDGTVSLQAIQHEDAVYPWSDEDFDDITGGSYLGDPNSPEAPENLLLVPDPTFASIGMLRWEYARNRFVRKFQVATVEVITPTSGPLIYEELSRVETIAREVPLPLIPVGDQPIVIEYRVYAISTTGVASPHAALQTILELPRVPASLGLYPSNFEVVSRPTSTDISHPTEPLGTVFDIELIGSQLAFVEVRTGTFTGLQSATTYSFRARTVNAFGKSAWFVESTTTTADAGPILDLIGDDLIDNVSDIVLPPLLAKIDELADVYDTRELIPAGVADAFTDLDLSREVVNETTVRREETRTLTASYTQLQADFTTEQGVNVARYSELTVAIATEESARVTQYNLLETRVEDNEASIGTTSEAVSDLEGALATQVTRIDAVTTQSNALVLQVAQAEADILGNAEAIAGLRVAVAGEDSQAQAELILSATVTNASQAVGRAYLGVQSVTAGVATINGIIVDGASNVIEFRANNVLFTDTGGNPSIYFDTAGGRFVFKGDILASNIIGSSFETSAAGYRVVMSPTFPLWYGNGTPGVSSPLFYLRSDGSIDISGSINAGSALVVNGGVVSYNLNAGVELARIGGSSSTVGNFITTGGGSLNNKLYFPGGGIVAVTRDGVDTFSTGGNFGQRGVTAIGTSFDFYAGGTGTYGPFTGSHEALVLKSDATPQGALVYDAELIAAPGISTTITRVAATVGAQCRAVVGAAVSRLPLDPLAPPAALADHAQLAELVEQYDVLVFNALGEGMLLAEGDLQPGDLLTSGEQPGVAVKQADDVVRSYTVAKCRQHLSAADGVKLIAVIYVAG